MAARFIRLVSYHGEEMFVRPETIMAFGPGTGKPNTSWLVLWGANDKWFVRETVQEIAVLLTDPQLGGPR
jgi:hypothetical protein